MNQVSWSRILQNAENGDLAEAGAAIIHLQDRAPHWRQRRGKTGYEASETSHLEGELRYALGQTPQKRMRQDPSRSIRQDTVIAAQNHSFPAYEQRARQGLSHRAENDLPAIVSNRSRPKRGSGAKNLIAIVISLAVIGFSFQQINKQWLEANRVVPAQPKKADASTASGVLVASATNAAEAKSEPKAEFEGNRLDLRPSFARADEASRPEKDALKQATGPRGASGGSSAEAEQTMIWRGHEMMRVGHIEGARLIFEHLATQNSALGAFALAQTYDRQFLSSQNITGVKPDQNLAAKWYQLAAELTNAAANHPAR